MANEVGESRDRDANSNLARKLDYLFRTVRRAGKEEYSARQVAAALTEAGTKISDTYVWQLRTGRATNPTIGHLRALAEFFGVPLSYFTDDEKAEAVEAQLAFVAGLRNRGVRRLALRAHGLSEDNLRVLDELARQFRAIQGLGDLPDDWHDSPSKPDTAS